MERIQLELSSIQIISANASEEEEEEEEEEIPPLATCQICMDVFGYYDLLRSFCGSTCRAEICMQCLIQHLTASIYSYYPGMLPKVRCPICLTLLNKVQWSPYIMHNEEYSHILDKYSTLCVQSCGFQSPCCHNSQYTMLPKAFTYANEEKSINLPHSCVEMVPLLREKVVLYATHQIDTEELYGFITTHFPISAKEIFELILRCLQDEERRANLLLYHLYLYPNTYTSCCRYTVCFKCKAANHHDLCNDFLPEKSLLECPSCHMTLVKVDGCNRVVCICGEHINWRDEVKKQELQRKQLAPSIEYNRWYRWKRYLKKCFVEMRERSIDQWIAVYRPILKKLIQRALRRARLHLIVNEYRTCFLELLRRFRHRHRKTIKAKKGEGQVYRAIAHAA